MILPEPRLQPLPLSISSFPKLRQTGKIYVDKTEIIQRLVEAGDKHFLVRPRRFGKSLLISTLESLFRHGLRDFEGLAIGRTWNEGTCSVLHLDFSAAKEFSTLEKFHHRLSSMLKDACLSSGAPVPPDVLSDPLEGFSGFLAAQPVNSLCVLIDEYDAPLTACLHRPELFTAVHEELSSLYLTLKRNDASLRFLFITGITRIQSTGIFSGLNDLNDWTLNPMFGTLLGYTRQEIEDNFAGYLARAESVLGLSRERLLSEMSSRYDGYCFDSRVRSHMFCPWSVLKFLNDPESGFDNYWFESGGTPSPLMQSLRNPSEFDRPQSVLLSALSEAVGAAGMSDRVLLAQTGYLTIKKVIDDTVELGYPNQEVAQSMARLYRDNLLAGKAPAAAGISHIDRLLSEGNAASLVAVLNRFFGSIDYKDYLVTSESACRAMVQVIIRAADLLPLSEVHSALGRSGLEVISGNCHWVFEFKFARKDEDSEKLLASALEQIRKKRCGEARTALRLIRMGLVFSAKERQFTAWGEAD